MRPLSIACCLALGGCSSVIADKDRNIFGDDLGRFEVTATLSESTCGAGAIGTPAEWRFQVQMSREPAAIYWNQGADAVEGVIAADGVSFLIESVTEVPITLGDEDPIECLMRRLDSARGILDDPGLDVPGFAGTLAYRFEDDGTAGCDALVGVPGGFSELPCRIDFTIDAERNLAPEDRR